MGELVEATGFPLISTKLQAPIPRPCVDRPRLNSAITEGLAGKVTLIAAPAGWGKSTLLADWHRSSGRHQDSAWVALDDEDNDPVRFWTYVIEALRALNPIIGRDSSPLLRTPGVRLPEVIPFLINELDKSNSPVVLILEDYHAIQSPGIHDMLTLLVERLPQHVRLLISTRSEPPLPLARWRARGELAEIDAQSLAFSDEEAYALFNDVHRLGLAAPGVRRLRERTEGWAAGLYLAALSIRGRKDPARFIEEFAGDDRLVADYLSAEVLAGQPETTRSFLLRTAILERFCPALCDAVTESTGSEQLLREIERSNFFLVPLDDRRSWYRYHHLFRELLLHDLGRTEPEIVSELHARACSWLLSEGLILEAIHHAIAGADFARAAELVAEHWYSFVLRGALHTVDRWLQTLPHEALLSDARLCLARAWTSFTVGRLTEVVPWADAAEGAPVPGPFYDGTTSVEGGVATTLASYWLVVGDIERTREAAGTAAGLEKDPAWLAVAINCLGAASYWLGDSQGAVDKLEQTVRLARRANPLVAIYALGLQAIIATDEAEWSRAGNLTADALQLSEQLGTTEYWVMSASHLARSRLYAARGQLSSAENEAERSIELAHRGGSALLIAYAMLGLADLRRAAGREEDAFSLFQEARGIIERCPDPGLAAQKLTGGGRAPRKELSADHAEPTIVDQLTERELAILHRLDSPLSQREIAAAVHLSLNTVKTHTRHIFRKLGVSSRADAVARARRLGLLQQRARPRADVADKLKDSDPRPPAG